MSTLPLDVESLGAKVDVSVGDSVGRSVVTMLVVGLPVRISTVGASVVRNSVEVGAALGLPAPESIVGVSVDIKEGSSERVAVVGVVVISAAVEVEVEDEDGMAVTSEDGAGVEVGRIEGMVECALEGSVVGPIVGAVVGIEVGEAAVRIISTRI